MARRMDGGEQAQVLISAPCCQNADPRTLERTFLMRRKRFQKGTVGARKHGRHRVWIAQWWQDGGRRSKVLGRCTEITKAQAEALMASILSPVNNGNGHQTAQVALFGAYIREVYLPLCRRKWKESTRMTTEPVISNHIEPAFEHKLMSSITREDLQRFLDQKAQNCREASSIICYGI